MKQKFFNRNFSLILPKRLVFNAENATDSGSQKPEDAQKNKIVEQTKSDISLEMQAIEAEIEAGTSIEQARDKLDKNISGIAVAAVASINPDPTKIVEGNTAFVQAIFDAEAQAKEQFKQSEKRYQNIQNFSREETNNSILLEKNDEAFQEFFANSVDAKHIDTLQQTALGLREAAQKLNLTDITDGNGNIIPKLEIARTTLLLDIQKQAEKFEQRAQEIRDFHFSNIEKQNDALKATQEALDSNLIPNLQIVNNLLNHQYYLEGLTKGLANTANNKDLLELGTQKLAEVKPVVEAASAKIKDSPKYAQAWSKLEFASKNYAAALAKWSKIENDATVPLAERQDTESWLAVAKDRYISAQDQIAKVSERTGTTMTTPAESEPIDMEDMPIAQTPRDEGDKV